MHLHTPLLHPTHKEWDGEGAREKIKTEKKEEKAAFTGYLSGMRVSTLGLTAEVEPSLGLSVKFLVPLFMRLETSSTKCKAETKLKAVKIPF